MKIKIPYRPMDFAVFLLLAFLCYEAHQLARHLVGAIFCKGFGTMTFTVTTTKQLCSFPMIVTLSGPLLTYGLAWLGLFLLLSPRNRLFAYALIFASFAHLRFIQTLTGRGDELILAEQWFGITSQAVVAAIVFLIGLPPVVAAFRVIGNQRRWLVFLCSWLLPLAILFALLFGNQFLFGANGVTGLSPSILGIALIVFVTDLIAGILFTFLWLRHRASHDTPN